MTSSSPASSPTHTSAPSLGPLFERVLDAVVVAPLATGRIVMWNGAAEKLFGYTAEEIIGQSIEILMPAPIAAVHRIGFERYVRTGRGLIVDADSPVEMPALTKSGDDIRVELTLSEIQDAGGARYAVAVLRDAMLRKHLELTNLELVQARVARSEAETELQMRDELLDTIAANLESQPTPAELERLVAALADFRRLHTGQMTLRVTDIDLVDVAHAAADVVRRRAPRRRLIIHTPPNAPVVCDPTRIRQVLDLVFDDMVNRTRDGARIELRLEMLTSQLTQLTLRSEACGDARGVGAGLYLGRTLLLRQGGTFVTSVSSGGALEVVITLPGSPHPARRRSPRTRRAPRK